MAASSVHGSLHARVVCETRCVHVGSIGIVAVLALAASTAACAVAPVSIRHPAPSRAKQARIARAHVTYRRLGVGTTPTAVDDAIASMGAGCVRIPIESISSSSGVVATTASDGDPSTVFNSDAHPPHALTVELAEPTTISALVLTTEQTPAGVTSHVVEVSDDRARWTEAGSLHGHTVTETAYAATVRGVPAARYVRIRTIESPSWVAFREVALVACARPARVSGDRVPRRSPVDRSGSRWVRGEGACERASDCAQDECCSPSTCVARAEAPRCAGVGCPRVVPSHLIECGCRASTCGAWVTPTPGLGPLGDTRVSPGSR
jgi:hypothetical protein